MLQHFFLMVIGFCSGIVIPVVWQAFLSAFPLCPATQVSHTPENTYYYMKILHFLELQSAIYFLFTAGTFQEAPFSLSSTDYFPEFFLEDGLWLWLKWLMFFPFFPKGSN